MCFPPSFVLFMHFFLCLGRLSLSLSLTLSLSQSCLLFLPHPATSSINMKGGKKKKKLTEFLRVRVCVCVLSLWVFLSSSLCTSSQIWRRDSGETCNVFCVKLGSSLCSMTHRANFWAYECDGWAAACDTWCAVSEGISESNINAFFFFFLKRNEMSLISPAKRVLEHLRAQSVDQNSGVLCWHVK